MPTKRILLQEIELNSDQSSVTFSGIPQNYTDLRIVATTRSTRTTTVANSGFYFNSSISDLSSSSILFFSGSTSAASTGLTDNMLPFHTSGGTASAGVFGSLTIDIQNYTSLSNKTCTWTCGYTNNSTADYNYVVETATGMYSNSNPIDSITFTNRSLDSANWASGSTFYLYGITHVPIIRGGEEYVLDGFKYHKFTSTAALQVIEPGDVEYLVVAGGGGGAQDTGGGGGGGGFRYGKLKASHNIYQIVVGSGGTYDSNGSDSSAFTITSTGGGAGGSGANGYVGKNGGSGGGGRGGDATSRSGGLGNTPSTVPSQGNNGGNNSTSSPGYGAGGGGGSSTVGSNGSSTSGGNGGSGSAWMDGNYYAGGGGGGLYTTGTSSTGGIGGGGSGGTIGYDGIPGSINTGGGGGGSGRNISAGINNGGSGIVIIRYPYDGN